ncbi:MAG: DrmE family protein [Oscillospiraceae bacterium]|nr:DrmE family protein [Oscillospiraceae bacterium]
MRLNVTKEAMGKIRIMLNDLQFSEEAIICKMREWIDNITSTEETHSSGIILHTGSDCFDAVLLVFAVLSCIIHNDTTPEEIIKGLQKGDKVLYKGALCEVLKPAAEGSMHSMYGMSIWLQNGEGGKNRNEVPQSLWNQIQPYYGEAAASGRTEKGKSISENALHFYQSVLGMSKKEVPSVLNTSFVIVMPRERAEYLFRSTSILFAIETRPSQIMLSDLVTATYYTENEEYQIGKNRSKNEAVIQFASDTETAGSLVRSRTENRKLGILICGQQAAARGKSDLENLMRRKKLAYSMLSLGIDTELSEWLVDTFCEKASFFNCTKEMLEQYYHPDDRTALNNDVAIRLNHQIERIIHNHVVQCRVDQFMDLETYYEVNKKIGWIANDEYQSDDKDQFVMYAFSVLKLLRSAVFTMQEMEEAIHAQNLRISTCRNRIVQLDCWGKKLPDKLKKWAMNVMETIHSVYARLEAASPKGEQLRSWLRDASDKKVAVIVPKKYYKEIMQQAGFFNLLQDPANLHVTTFLTFDNYQDYDLVIATCADAGMVQAGRTSGGRLFNPMRCYRAEEVRILMYECENKVFMRKRRKVEMLEEKLNQYSSLPVTYERHEIPVVSEREEQALSEIESLESSTEAICAKWAARHMAGDLHFEHGSSGQETTEVIRLAMLDSGERVLFSKRYIAYVYSEEDNSVCEMPADQLTEGDTLIFTENNADIVDVILDKRVHSAANAEALPIYVQSKRWKSRLQVKRKMMKWSVRELAEHLKQSTNIPVEVQTIMNWLDESYHIVAPQNIECLRCIGKFCNDSALIEKTEEYFQACHTIRSMRRDILKEIGKTIRCLITNTVPEELLQDPLYIQLREQAQLAAIEAITAYQANVPVGQANHPF